MTGVPGPAGPRSPCLSSGSCGTRTPGSARLYTRKSMDPSLPHPKASPLSRMHPNGSQPQPFFPPWPPQKPAAYETWTPCHCMLRLVLIQTHLPPLQRTQQRTQRQQQRRAMQVARCCPHSTSPRFPHSPPSGRPAQRPPRRRRFRAHSRGRRQTTAPTCPRRRRPRRSPSRRRRPRPRRHRSRRARAARS